MESNNISFDSLKNKFKQFSTKNNSKKYVNGDVTQLFNFPSNHNIYDTKSLRRKSIPEMSTNIVQPTSPVLSKRKFALSSPRVGTKKVKSDFSFSKHAFQLNDQKLLNTGNNNVEECSSKTFSDIGLKEKSQRYSHSAVLSHSHVKNEFNTNLSTECHTVIPEVSNCQTVTTHVYSSDKQFNLFSKQCTTGSNKQNCLVNNDFPVQNSSNKSCNQGISSRRSYLLEENGKHNNTHIEESFSPILESIINNPYTFCSEETVLNITGAIKSNLKEIDDYNGLSSSIITPHKGNFNSSSIPKKSILVKANKNNHVISPLKNKNSSVNSNDNVKSCSPILEINQNMMSAPPVLNYTDKNKTNIKALTEVRELGKSTNLPPYLGIDNCFSHDSTQHSASPELNTNCTIDPGKLLQKSDSSPNQAVDSIKLAKKMILQKEKGQPVSPVLSSKLINSSSTKYIKMNTDPNKDFGHNMLVSRRTLKSTQTLHSDKIIANKLKTVKEKPKSNEGNSNLKHNVTIEDLPSTFSITNCNHQKTNVPPCLVPSLINEINFDTGTSLKAQNQLQAIPSFLDSTHLKEISENNLTNMKTQDLNNKALKSMHIVSSHLQDEMDDMNSTSSSASPILNSSITIKPANIKRYEEDINKFDNICVLSQVLTTRQQLGQQNAHDINVAELQKGYAINFNKTNLSPLTESRIFLKGDIFSNHVFAALPAPKPDECIGILSKTRLENSNNVDISSTPCMGEELRDFENRLSPVLASNKKQKCVPNKRHQQEYTEDNVQFPFTSNCITERSMPTINVSSPVLSKYSYNTNSELRLQHLKCPKTTLHNSPNRSNQVRPVQCSNLHFSLAKDTAIVPSPLKLLIDQPDAENINIQYGPMLSKCSVSPQIVDSISCKDGNITLPSFNSELDISHFPITLSQNIEHFQSPEVIMVLSTKKNNYKKCSPEVTKTHIDNTHLPSSSNIDCESNKSRLISEDFKVRENVQFADKVESVATNPINNRNRKKIKKNLSILYKNETNTNNFHIERCLIKSNLSFEDHRTDISGVEHLPSSLEEFDLNVEVDKYKPMSVMRKCHNVSINCCKNSRTSPESQVSGSKEELSYWENVDELFCMQQDKVLIEDKNVLESNSTNRMNLKCSPKKNELCFLELHPLSDTVSSEDRDLNEQNYVVSTINSEITCQTSSSDESDNEIIIQEDFTQESSKSQEIDIEYCTSPYTKSIEEIATEELPGAVYFPPPLNILETKDSVNNILDSAAKTKKSKFKKGSLVERLKRLVRSERADVNMFHHVGASHATSRTCSLLVSSVTTVFSRVLLSCRYTDTYKTCSEELSAGEEVVNPEVRAFMDPDFAKNIAAGSIIIIYPPWRSLWLDGRGLMMMYQVSKVRVVSTGHLLRFPPTLTAETLLYKYQCHTQDEKCGCRQTLMSQLFGQPQVSVAQMWPDGSIMASLAAVRPPNNTHLQLTLLHKFNIRNPTDEVMPSLLCLDSNKQVCQINLRSADDLNKLKTLVECTNTDTFVLDKLAICKRVNVERASGLRSMMSVLHPESMGQHVMYVAALWSNLWSAQPATPSHHTDQLTMIPLAQYEQEGVTRVSGRVCVIALRGSQLYVWDPTVDSYHKVSITPSAALPKFMVRSTLDINFLWVNKGQLTIDKFTEVKVMAETSCDTRMSVPLPTMATCEGELVLLDDKLQRS